jgi:receptor tyrosine kinase
LVEDLDELCQKPASKLLCAYAFPKCKIIDGISTKLPLCYEDCIAVQKLFCFNTWVLLEDKKSKGNNLKNRGHFRLPDCEALPKYNKSSKSPTCSYVGITEMNPSEITCKFKSLNQLVILIIFDYFR